MQAKFLTLISLLISLSPAYAMGPGFYLGMQAGQTNTHNIARIVNDSNGLPQPTATTPSNTGFGGRLAVGYAFTPIVAIEAGYTRYASASYSSPAKACSNPRIEENAADVIGKGTYTPVEGLGLFGKAGLARISVNAAGSLASPYALSPCGNASSTTKAVRPTIGLGASYDLNQSWQADVSWARVMKGSQVQNADLIAIGISYHFTDKYCGQFLC